MVMPAPDFLTKFTRNRLSKVKRRITHKTIRECPRGTQLLVCYGKRMKNKIFNLYGIPFRSYLLLNQNISWIRQAELRMNQFSSQERNQVTPREERKDLFDEIHTNFHTYFVTIITVLSAVISAFIFIIIVWRAYNFCCKSSKRDDETMAFSVDIEKTSKSSNSDKNEKCQEVNEKKAKKTRHLPCASLNNSSAICSRHYVSYKSPLCQCMTVDSIYNV